MNCPHCAREHELADENAALREQIRAWKHIANKRYEELRRSLESSMRTAFMYYEHERSKLGTE